jgi:hypothetical protein
LHTDFRSPCLRIGSAAVNKSKINLKCLLPGTHPGQSNVNLKAQIKDYLAPRTISPEPPAAISQILDQRRPN